ncbi:hypothetical protein HMPREF2139_08050 [Prevotella denticola DNF00960]|nr:hypothetical protein HMPREF2139_08050 [Prevotella denticola DNF00960]
MHWLLFYACKITFFISVCKGKDRINHKKKQRVTAGFPADDIFSVPVLYFHLSFFYLPVGMSVFKEIPSIYIMESHDYCPEESVYETEYPAVMKLTYINISLYGR